MGGTAGPVRAELAGWQPTSSGPRLIVTSMRVLACCPVRPSSPGSGTRVSDDFQKHTSTWMLSGSRNTSRAARAVDDRRVTVSELTGSARYTLDVRARRNGKAHVVETGTALVERHARVVRMLDQPNAQPAGLHKMNPGELSRLIESVASDLEPEYVCIPAGAHVAVRDREV
jgi:hypothetical protein